MLNQTDLSRIDLNLLVLFEAVMQDRHVGRAADRLNLSPSAVSHGLGRLRKLMNDPLFLRTPRGVVPSDRATALAPRITDILSAVRGVVADAEPFDPATSARRFRIGLFDAMLGVFGSALLAAFTRVAPFAGLSILHVLPSFRNAAGDGEWDHVLAQLEARELDAAIFLHQTNPPIPARFDSRLLGADRLVAVTRTGHPYARNPSFETYCAARHMLISQSGDARGVIDSALASLGLSREVAVTVPSFMTGLAMIATTDLIVGLPQSLVRALGKPFDVTSTPLPMEVDPAPIAIVTTRAASADAGVAWFRDMILSVIRLDPP